MCETFYFAAKTKDHRLVNSSDLWVCEARFHREAEFQAKVNKIRNTGISISKEYISILRYKFMHGPFGPPPFRPPGFLEYLQHHLLQFIIICLLPYLYTIRYNSRYI